MIQTYTKQNAIQKRLYILTTLLNSDSYEKRVLLSKGIRTYIPKLNKVKVCLGDSLIV